MPTTIKISVLREQNKKGIARMTYDSSLFGDQGSILGNSSITLENQTEDFSFKNNSSENEDLLNPNILDKDGFSKLKHKNILLKDKFDNQEDPIFNLDESPPVMENKLNVNNDNKSSIVNRKLRLSNTSSSKRRY